MTPPPAAFPALEGSRFRCDPVADRLVGRLFAVGGPPAVDALMRHLVSHEHMPTEVPDTVSDAVERRSGAAGSYALNVEIDRFLARSSRLPREFACDPEQLRRGQETFMSEGLLSLVALLHMSLPTCYLLRNGSEVLGVTQELEAHTFRRILETAQMVVAVMSEGGVEVVSDDGGDARLVGPGVAEAQKVRLLHAAIRHLLMHPVREEGSEDDAGGLASTNDIAAHMKRKPWDVAAFGRPINQMDMAYTLLTFGHVIPRALEHMGVPLTAEGHAAFLHTWNVVGYCMGLEEGLMAHDAESADELLAWIQATEGGPSENGKALTGALLTCITRVIDVPGVDWLPHVLVHQYLGPGASRMLGVPEPDWAEDAAYALIHALVRVVTRVEAELTEESILMRWVYLTFGRLVVGGLADLPRPDGDVRGGRPIATFDLSSDHRRNWGLPPERA